MAGRKGFIDTSKQKKDSSSIVHVYSDVHRDRYVCEFLTPLYRKYTTKMVTGIMRDKRNVKGKGTALDRLSL